MKKKINKIGAYVLTRRKELGMSQAELSQRAKIAQPQLCRIENGKWEHVTGSTLVRLSVGLKVPLKDMMSLFDANRRYAIKLYIRDLPEEALMNLIKYSTRKKMNWSTAAQEILVNALQKK